jgi:hypothetical protein
MTLHLLTLVDGTPHEYTDTFVVEFDPTVHREDGTYDGGLLRVTRDPSQARQFANFEELARYWQQDYGLRADGEPNRPLTAFNVEVAP